MPPQTITDPPPNRSCWMMLQDVPVSVCHMWQLWTCSHLWREWGKCQLSWTVLGCEHRFHYRTSRPHAILMESVSDSLPTGGHFVGLWQCFSCSSLLLGCYCPSTTLSSSHRAMAHLLVSPPHSWDCAGWSSKPSCDGTYGCAILEELDYLCNLNGLQVTRLTVVPMARAKFKTREKSVRKDMERGMCLWPPPAKLFPFYGLSLLSCPPVVAFICTKTGEIDSQ